jgi:hypothetical protein
LNLNSCHRNSVITPPTIMSKFVKYPKYSEGFDTVSYCDADRISAEPKSKRVTSIEAVQPIGFEMAGIVASASPLGIPSMGTFPSSLFGFGRIRRQHFDDALTLSSEKKSS